MNKIASSPLLENGGFFVARNNRPRAVEHSVSLTQSLMAGLSLALFVGAGLAWLMVVHP